jgi:threonine dehydrogenase-like Zn-dependent dehydrogenase
MSKDEQKAGNDLDRRSFLKGVAVTGALAGSIATMAAAGPSYAAQSTGDNKITKKTMKAAIYYGPGDIRIEERPIPSYTAEGMLIRVKACGICDIIDLPMWERWPEGGRGIGQGIGHEWSGEVVEVGSKVTEVKPGDRVYGHRNAPCYRCESCLHGDYERCNNPFGGIEVQQGACAEYISFHRVLQDRGLVVFPKDDGVNFRDLAMVEPLELSVALAKKAKAGDVVVIFGQELVALGIVPFLKKRNVAKIITVEPSEIRRNASRALGADIVVNPLKEDVISVVMNQTNGKGAEKIIISDERPIATQQAMSCIRHYGDIWLTKPSYYMQLNPNVVNMHPINWRQADAGYAEPAVKFDPALFSMQTAWGTLGPYKERWWAGYEELLKTGKITAAKVVTKVFPLEKINEAFEAAMNTYENIKVQVEP